jgi:hypothetical protein
MVQRLIDIPAALTIVKHVVAERKRWGHQAGTAGYNTHTICDALIVLADAGNFDAPTREELTKANRQLAASAAREAGLKKRIAELTGKAVETEEETPPG